MALPIYFAVTFLPVTKFQPDLTKEKVTNFSGPT